MKRAFGGKAAAACTPSPSPGECVHLLLLLPPSFSDISSLFSLLLWTEDLWLSRNPPGLCCQIWTEKLLSAQPFHHFGLSRPYHVSLAKTIPFVIVAVSKAGRSLEFYQQVFLREHPGASSSSQQCRQTFAWGVGKKTELQKVSAQG